MSRRNRSPAERRNQLSLHHQSIRYSGPLPPAEEFARYDATLPGAARAILEMAQQQADHRRREERRALTAEIVERLGSNILAFFFTICALSTAAYCAKQGQGGAASVIGGGTIGAVVSAFLWRKTK